LFNSRRWSVENACCRRTTSILRPRR